MCIFGNTCLVEEGVYLKIYIYFFLNWTLATSLSQRKRDHTCYPWNLPALLISPYWLCWVWETFFHKSYAMRVQVYEFRQYNLCYCTCHWLAQISLWLSWLMIVHIFDANPKCCCCCCCFILEDYIAPIKYSSLFLVWLVFLLQRNCWGIYKHSDCNFLTCV